MLPQLVKFLTVLISKCFQYFILTDEIEKIHFVIKAWLRAVIHPPAPPAVRARPLPARSPPALQCLRERVIAYTGIESDDN